MNHNNNGIEFVPIKNIQKNIEELNTHKKKLKELIYMNEVFLSQLFQQTKPLGNNTQLKNHLQISSNTIDKYKKIINEYNKEKFSKTNQTKYNSTKIIIYKNDIELIENDLTILQIQQNTFQKIDDFFESLHQAFQIQSSIQNLVKKRKQLSNLL